MELSLDRAGLLRLKLMYILFIQVKKKVYAQSIFIMSMVISACLLYQHSKTNIAIRSIAPSIDIE